MRLIEVVIGKAKYITLIKDFLTVIILYKGKI